MRKIVKYKLIKIYPGSPDVGTIREVETNNGNVITNKTWELIHLYPEFWEEVVEKEYEILSYIGTKTKDYIKSVKRLSDGEIFTIGDTLVNSDVIKSIGLVEGKIRIYPQNSFYKLEFAIKAKKPKLFTTVDGVDIYEGDKYYWVNKTSFSSGNQNSSSIWRYNDTNVRFSSKEKMIEYLVMNKPCLSINDLLNMEYKRGIPLFEFSHDDMLTIKTVVEQKIKDNG